MSGSEPDLGWDRKRFMVPVGTVYVLDRAASILILNHDPGEGFEVRMPVHGGIENMTVGKEQNWLD